jgi:hypothetical protein
MGLAALAATLDCLDNRWPVTDLLAQISTLLGSSTRDLDQIEHTLTDGYAHALALDAERLRLEKRMTSVTQGIKRGDTAKKARELAEISERLDGNAGDAEKLRALLAELRRHADGVRVGSPSR